MTPALRVQLYLRLALLLAVVVYALVLTVMSYDFAMVTP